MFSFFLSWMEFCVVEAPSRMFKRSGCWGMFFILGALATIGVCLVAAYFPLEQWIMYLKYFCGMWAIMTLMLIREFLAKIKF